MEVSRQPGDYRPTTHAGQQRKDRGIEWDWVGETIKEGAVREVAGDAVAFIKNIHKEGNVRVVADPDNGEVITITWESSGAERKHSPYK